MKGEMLANWQIFVYEPLLHFERNINMSIAKSYLGIYLIYELKTRRVKQKVCKFSIRVVLSIQFTVRRFLKY